jgi:hypothetical protein
MIVSCSVCLSVEMSHPPYLVSEYEKWDLGAKPGSHFNDKKIHPKPVLSQKELHPTGEGQGGVTALLRVLARSPDYLR